jgi:hypothetical protein
MKKNIAFIILICIFCSIFSIYPQTIEDKLLKKKERKILNYYYQAKARGRIPKLHVIDNITTEIDSGYYTKDDAKLVDVVRYLSEEGSMRQEYEDNRLVNDFPDVRRNACILLGKIGGDQAREALINVLAYDDNYMVKAEACNSLALIKDDPSGFVLRTIVFVYRSTYQPDANFTVAVINAIKTIAKGNEQVYGDAITVLSEIQMGQHQRRVREEAYNAIESLNED